MTVAVAFITGLLAGGGAVFLAALRLMRPRHADYKERWLQAVRLLGQEGRITDEQLTSLQSGTQARKETARLPVPGNTQALLDGMTSSDRCALEIRRAASGLPPLDNLHGMTSSDQKRVIESRMRHGQTELDD